ncbi:MAG: hypothetical protein AAF725_14630 [Acidobacteriota bacterium]
MGQILTEESPRGFVIFDDGGGLDLYVTGNFDFLPPEVARRVGRLDCGGLATVFSDEFESGDTNSRSATEP